MEAPAVFAELAPSGVDHVVHTFTVAEILPDVYRGVLGDGRPAVLPLSEIGPGRRLSPSDHVLCTIMINVERPVCTTTRPELLAAVYAGICPEVRTGEVRIVAIARVPGVRSKMAVAATAAGVDAVAACVGREANRVAYVSRLLGGERIDIIAYHPDLATYAANALAPARIDEVAVAADKITVQVPAHQMPAAVGGSGLNTHLAGELLGLPVEVEQSR
jgi:transcription termination/antitermination protein NusA